MDRQTKEQTIADLQQRFSNAQAAVLTEYRGLTVAELTALRRELREVASEYHVAKNTLVELAIEGTPYLSLKALLAGQNGLVFGYGDTLELTKVLARYAREHEKFIIKGGVTEGQFLEAAEVAELAKLPSRDILRAQLLGVLTQPAVRLASVLSVPATQLARILDARKDQLDT